MAALKRIEVHLAAPESRSELVISSVAFYKLRVQFGGANASMMIRMKELEDENRLIKTMYLEKKLKSEIVAEALANKLVRSSRRREIAQLAVQARGIPKTAACAALW